MARQHCQLIFSAASNGAQWNRRRSQPQPGPTFVFPVFPLQSFHPPAYQHHNNYYYILNLDPSMMVNYGYQHQISNLETSFNVVWMQRSGYVQEDETWVLDGIGLETEEDTMILGDGCLSEEVVSKCLKTRKGNHEVVGKEKDEEPKICVVCLDNLHQENQTIGVLHCGHEYHACCIKKWLRRRNICPLCKTTAIICR